MTHIRSLRWLACTLALLLAHAACADAGGDAPVVEPGDVAALVSAPDGPLLLDVRTPQEFAQGHVPTATLLPIQELGTRMDELAPYKERGIVVYCESGKRAGLAIEQLAAAGYQNLKLMDGSMKRWRAEGRSVEK